MAAIIAARPSICSSRKSMSRACFFLGLIEAGAAALWQSIPLHNGAPASTAEQAIAARSLHGGHSVLCIPNMASEAECDFLVRKCSAAASEHAANGVWWNGVWWNVTGLVRLPSLAAAARSAESETPLYRRDQQTGPLLMPSSADAVCEAILLRLLAFVDAELPAVAQLQFGTEAASEEASDASGSSASPLGRMYESNEFAFAAREPAVNVYAAGGQFTPHKDNQAFTVLVPLTSPDSFEGGGTGFWCAEAARKMAEAFKACEAEEAARSKVARAESTACEAATGEEERSASKRLPASGAEGEVSFSAAAGTDGVASPGAAAEELERLSASPTIVLKPERGTAMLWNGDVLHSGMRLESGTRVVFVASFSNANHVSRAHNNGSVTGSTQGARRQHNANGARSYRLRPGGFDRRAPRKNYTEQITSYLIVSEKHVDEGSEQSAVSTSTRVTWWVIEEQSPGMWPARCGGRRRRACAWSYACACQPFALAHTCSLLSARSQTTRRSAHHGQGT